MQRRGGGGGVRVERVKRRRKCNIISNPEGDSQGIPRMRTDLGPQTAAQTKSGTAAKGPHRRGPSSGRHTTAAVAR